MKTSYKVLIIVAAVLSFTGMVATLSTGSISTDLDTVQKSQCPTDPQTLEVMKSINRNAYDICMKGK